MIEVELKFEIKKSEIEKIISQLKKLLFIVGERTYEKTTMYDNPSMLMQRTNGRIRLRTIKANKSTCFELSYKKPIEFKKGIKHEIEHELETSQGNELTEILHVMDYHEISSYERFRTTITKENIKVTIDEYPFATFIEIEGSKQKIISLARRLNLNLADNLIEPCDTLFTKWRKDKGLKFKAHMLFKDFDK